MYLGSGVVVGCGKEPKNNEENGSNLMNLSGQIEWLKKWRFV